MPRATAWNSSKTSPGELSPDGRGQGEGALSVQTPTLESGPAMLQWEYDTGARRSH